MPHPSPFHTLETVVWTDSADAPSVTVFRPHTPEGVPGEGGGPSGQPGIGGRPLPPGRIPQVLPFVYVHLAREEAALFHGKQAEWEAAHGPFPALLVTITGNDWERDFTPWPAPRLFRGSPDFAGGADACLARLTNTLVPAVETRLAGEGFVPSLRFLAGYSLAGLFALYALYASPTKAGADASTDASADGPGLFTGCVCGSPSVWYPGFREFALARPVAPSWRFFHGSVGDREGKAKNPRLAPIEDNLRAVTEHLRNQGVHTVFQLHAGGHFQDPPPGRLWQGVEAAVAWSGSGQGPTPTTA